MLFVALPLLAIDLVAESSMFRWLTKQGSLFRTLKERFATLTVGPNSSVLFDYREDVSSPKVLGMFTLGPAAKCVAGDACPPYPAHLVLNLFFGDGDSHVLLCFDNQQELVSFRDAVAFGLGAKNHLQAVLEQKAEAKKKEEEARMLVQMQEKEKAMVLEQQIVQVQRLISDNEVANARIELDRQLLEDSVIQLRLSASAEKQKLEEEQEKLRASMSQELLEAKRSAEETAARASMLAASNRDASLSLAELESSIDRRFVAFRKRENSTTVLRTVDVTELNRRLEAEKLEMLAREQDALDRAANKIGEQTRRDVEAAVALRAAGSKLDPQAQEQATRQHCSTSERDDDARTRRLKELSENVAAAPTIQERAKNFVAVQAAAPAFARGEVDDIRVPVEERSKGLSCSICSRFACPHP